MQFGSESAITSGRWFDNEEPLWWPLVMVNLVSAAALARSIAVCMVGHSWGSLRAEPPSPQEQGVDK